MDLIGKTTINPILFYTGKISGYLTWIILLLSVLGVPAIETYSSSLLKYTAYVLSLVGLSLIVVSLINLGRSTRLGLPQEDTVLKTGGLYRFSRNPMYLGFDLLTLASIIYTMNIGIISLGLYSLIVYHLIILGEEKFLSKSFGKAYYDYRQKTRRYL
ncbi:MAG: isoprenylcysteine carboxylmethyltransferase family protein [Candidatus Edwardsbacteria bacterium]|nr:isoprenylcysteine carboxylmethyltransferase family protein [Candidatus Edwardsbacteria bacterium]